MDIQGRYQNLVSLYTQKEISRATLIRQAQRHQEEVSVLQMEIDILLKAQEILKKLLEDMTRDNLESLDKIVTDGLRQIFHDQTDLTFKSEMVEWGNQLNISFKTEQGSASGKSIDSFGASVTVVESLLIRIIVILKLGLAPVLLLDESLAQVSDNYVEPLGNLLRNLCREMGLTILLVTHQQGFIETADVVYKADCIEKGDIRTLTLKCLKDIYEESHSN
jgi:hypothetical protein